jgi:sec-independent protein translocase protein TatA
MFGIGLPEALIILLIIVVIFGAGKIPQLGAGLGKGIKNFQRALKGEDVDHPAEKKEEKK